ncbi:MAG: HAMP domain-containing protein [Chloroflexi bacterium]|nr:HAMP domain-containing protein [Chloroflexota bacterium]
MNRLWVRLSLMISAVLFVVFFLQFLSITFDNHEVPSQSPIFETPAEIQRRLLNFMVFSLGVGLVGGAGIAQVIVHPISKLSQAAKRLGKGELDIRVPARGSREMIELAEAFNKMAADLQQAQQSRRNLVADVSHELRTPLTVLEGNLRAVLDHVYALDESEAANLYEQTRHLIRLVNDLREISLAESGQLMLENAPTDLNALILDVMQALEPLSAEKLIRMEYEPTSPLEGGVDSVRIRQVLFNLLGNAIRHTPQEGRILIRARMEARGMTVSIQDSGDGLTPTELASVFDRFYRADKSRARETGGTGLGLSIARAIVEAHGGRIWAESDGGGRGSVFSFFIPS